MWSGSSVSFNYPLSNAQNIIVFVSVTLQLECVRYLASILSVRVLPKILFRKQTTRVCDKARMLIISKSWSLKKKVLDMLLMCLSIITRAIIYTRPGFGVDKYSTPEVC